MEDAPPPPSNPLVLSVRSALLLFVLFITLGAAAQMAHVAWGLWFTELFLFLGLPLCLVRRSGRDPVRYPGLGWIGVGPAAMGYLLGAANFLAFVAPAQYLVQSVFPESIRKAFDSSAVFENQTGLEMAFVLAAVSIAAPVCEEYFFRGVFQQGLRRGGVRPATAVVVTAALFSAFHLDPVGFLARFELGILFGLLTLRTGSLWPAILAHAANNSVSSAIFLAARNSAGEVSEGVPELSAIAAVAGVGGLFFFSLLWAIRQAPGLMPPAAPLEDSVGLPPAPAGRVYGAWVGGMVLAVGLLLAVDSRQVALNFFDSTHGLPELPEGAPPEKREARAALEDLRLQARRGEVPLERYYEARKALMDKPGLEPRLPVPPEAAPVPDPAEQAR